MKNREIIKLERNCGYYINYHRENFYNEFIYGVIGDEPLEDINGMWVDFEHACMVDGFLYCDRNGKIFMCYDYNDHRLSGMLGLIEAEIEMGYYEVNLDEKQIYDLSSINLNQKYICLKILRALDDTWEKYPFSKFIHLKGNSLKYEDGGWKLFTTSDQSFQVRFESIIFESN